MSFAFPVTRAIAFWDRLRGSFWFMPAFMALGAIALSFAMIRLDAEMEDHVYGRIGFLYLFGPEGARAILSAVATSMITVAGLTFSITMLTLQLASSQYGPRMLRNFMRDRGNQLVLGTFISTFVYCLLVLRTVKGVEGASFVPHLAVAVGVVLAVASLAVLIFFIHHTASSIRIETLLASLAAETRATIDRLFPDKLGHGTAHGDGEADKPLDFSRGIAINPKKSGYVQAVDGATLLDVAVKQDLVIRIASQPGTFVTERDPLVWVLSPKTLSTDAERNLRESLIIGNERTPDQDFEFSIRRIVEIAQRSLSPGINDPTTALYCIDRLREAFVYLAGRELPSSRRFDDDGKLRVYAVPVSPEDMAVSAFAAVAQYAGTDADVLHALAIALDRVIEEPAGDRYPRLRVLRGAVSERYPSPPGGTPPRKQGRA